MNPIQHAELSSMVSERITDKSKIKQLLTVAAAIAIAYSHALPTGPEAVSGQRAYLDTVYAPITSDINAFNEGTTISLDLAETVARAFWLHRFYSAYPITPIPLVDDEETHFMGKLLGCGHLIPPDVLELCNQESVLVLSAINKIRQ